MSLAMFNALKLLLRAVWLVATLFMIWIAMVYSILSALLFFFGFAITALLTGKLALLIGHPIHDEARMKQQMVMAFGTRRLSARAALGMWVQTLAYIAVLWLAIELTLRWVRPG